MRFTLRLLIVCCYFLPCTFFFTTCSGLRFDVAYNKKDSARIMQDNEKSIASVTELKDQQDSTFTNDSTKDLVSSEKNIQPDQIEKDQEVKEALSDKILRKLIMPTNTSLSGVGATLYFKNMAGQILIGASFLLSLLLLILWKILKKKNFPGYLHLLNTMCLAVFIIDGIIADVSLLYGTWLLFALILFQCIIELRIIRQHQTNKKQINLQFSLKLNF